ncbi:hypothetical protein [Comamonas koreensis]|uniref:Lipoprotein n=1 Tax=Comamonas koreensis TaxID=160825 RepID=A0AAW4Y453_9BURK|nr:hypothetical protein [Comamonas koreensis]MCD2168066.1 hypothetical protein [Comamonas koreensis]
MRLIAILLAASAVLMGCEPPPTLEDIQRKVLADSIDQYNIVANGGSAMDRCVRAGLVSAAAVQAKDSAQHERWRQVEKDDCAAAGVPKN